MILNVEQYKELKETNATDEKILFSIKSVQDFIFNYTRNDFMFHDSLKVSELTFIESENKIVGNFWKNIRVGQKLRVDYSYANNNVYTIVEKTDEHIIVAEDVIDETSICETYIVEFPAGLVNIALNMVDFDLETRRNGVASESISRHSITFQDIDAYPRDIITQLTKYAVFGW